MEEKIGIEKLLSLLNEYEKEIKSSYFWGTSYGKLECSVGGTDHDLYEEEIAMVIKSKEYGFIKWLVREDKIDRVEVWSTGMTKPTYGYTTEPYTTCKSIKLENTILMVLSISDTPIEDLISYLK